MGKLSWSKTGTIKSFEDRLTLQAELAEPRIVTVQFTTQSYMDSNRFPILLDADITWSTEGNSTNRRVTVFNGVSVSGIGDTFKIVIGPQAPYMPPPVPQPTIPTPIPVSILVGPGTRAYANEPPVLLTQNYVWLAVDAMAPSMWTVPAHNFINIPIPQNCGVQSALIFMVRNNPADRANVEGKLIASQEIDTAAIIAQGYPDGLKWFPILAGADSLSIENTDTIEWWVRPIWGIDG